MSMDSPTPAQTPPPPAIAEDKTVAIVSYMTMLGFIIAIIIHTSKKTKLGAFHLRQMLGLWLTVIALIIVHSISSPFGSSDDLVNMAFMLLAISIIVLWVLGLIAAVNGQMKPMPVVGPLYQKWFGTTFD